MTSALTRFRLWAAALSLSIVAAGSAQADALSTPSLGATLSGNPTPFSVEAGPLGKVYISGAATALGYVQDHSAPGDRDGGVDVSNAQVFIQKIDGPVQFYIQAGAYSLPSLGTPYWGLTNSSKANSNYFGAVPVAYLKLAPTSEFSILVGKLPTLVGAESTFTFQNANVARGLLWNQEPAVSKGMQLNYAKGPWAISLSLNDGFYSDKYNWLSGSVAYTFSPKDSLTFVGAGNFASTAKSTVATPYLQNNGSIYNLIWTHTEGPWTVTPYLQYSDVPKNTNLLILKDTSTFGGAVIAKYSFPKGFSLAGRGEYIASSGAYPLLYGPKSKAWSLTLTPTWQVKQLFVRGEVSYTKAEDAPAGWAFGKLGTDASQTRGMIETGVLF